MKAIPKWPKRATPAEVYLWGEFVRALIQGPNDLWGTSDKPEGERSASKIADDIMQKRRDRFGTQD